MVVEGIIVLGRRSAPYDRLACFFHPRLYVRRGLMEGRCRTRNQSGKIKFS
jgi:hypothetical protein